MEGSMRFGTALIFLILSVVSMVSMSRISEGYVSLKFICELGLRVGSTATGSKTKEEQQSGGHRHLKFSAVSRPLSIWLLEQLKMIRKQGYPAEAHRVTTEDGYILEMHR